MATVRRADAVPLRVAGIANGKTTPIGSRVAHRAYADDCRALRRTGSVEGRQVVARFWYRRAVREIFLAYSAPHRTCRIVTPLERRAHIVVRAVRCALLQICIAIRLFEGGAMRVLRALDATPEAPVHD